MSMCAERKGATMSLTDVLLAVLVAAGIWAVAELAITIRKARKSIDEVTASANHAIDEIEPIIAKADGMVDDLQPSAKQVEPILESARDAVDSANESLAKINGILDDVSEVSGTAADATNVVSAGVARVAAGAATAGARIASALGAKPRGEHALEEGAPAAEPEDAKEASSDKGYVTYPSVQESQDADKETGR